MHLGTMSREQKIKFLNDLTKGKKNLRELKRPERWFPFLLYDDPTRPDVYVWPSPRYREVNRDVMEDWATSSGFRFLVIILKTNTSQWDELEGTRKRFGIKLPERATAAHFSPNGLK